MNVIPEPVLDVAVRNGLSGGDGVDYQKQKQIVGEFEVSVLSRTLRSKKKKKKKRRVLRLLGAFVSPYEARISAFPMA